MHEIGHIVLDHSEDSELAEKEVKFFAKYALAPPVLIHKLKLDNPESIAQTFEISYEAACYAYSYYQNEENDPSKAIEIQVSITSKILREST